MPHTFNDFRPETRSLINRLIANGCQIVRGDNGEDEFIWTPANVDGFLDNLLACDEANLFVRTLDTKVKRLYLVLGNSPGEIVCDFPGNCPLLDEIIEAHYNEWEGRKQPTVECFARGDFAVWTAPDGTSRSVKVDIGGRDSVKVSWKTGPDFFESAWTTPDKLTPFGSAKFLEVKP